MDRLQELQEELKELNKCYRGIQQDAQEMKQKLNKLAGANAELGDLRQENGELRRKLSSLQASAIEFYRLMERTLSHSDLNEKYQEATKKFLSSFERYLCPHLGLVRIAPLPGEPFQDEFHQAVGDKPQSSVTQEFVLECSGWGFKIANWEDRSVPETVKPAQVVITELPIDADKVAPSNVVETETQINVGQLDSRQVGSKARIENENLKTEVTQTERITELHEKSLSTELPSQAEDESEVARDIFLNKEEPEVATASTSEAALKGSNKGKDHSLTAEISVPLNKTSNNLENQSID